VQLAVGGYEYDQRLRGSPPSLGRRDRRSPCSESRPVRARPPATRPPSRARRPGFREARPLSTACPPILTTRAGCRPCPPMLSSYTA
jgi:hypothetical protein